MFGPFLAMFAVFSPILPASATSGNPMGIPCDVLGINEIHKKEPGEGNDNQGESKYSVTNVPAINYQRTKVASPLPPSHMSLKVGRRLQKQ